MKEFYSFGGMGIGATASRACCGPFQRKALRLRLSSRAMSAIRRGVQLMEAEELAGYIRNGTRTVHVIDVRDDDRAGGHIRGSLHIPCYDFLSQCESYGSKWGSEHKVVFHCMMSQSRGPRCAIAFADNSQRLLGDGAPSTYLLQGGFQNVAANYNKFADIIEAFDSRYY